MTVRESLVELLELPDVPVMVTVTVPVVAVLLAVSVKALLDVAGFGVNVAVTPLGRPEADRLTLPLKPFCGVTLMVLEPAVPCVMVKLLGEADSTKPVVGADPGQLFTKLAALRVPMPVAKSQPVVVPYAGLKELLEVESTPCVPAPEGL